MALFSICVIFFVLVYIKEGYLKLIIGHFIGAPSFFHYIYLLVAAICVFGVLYKSFRH